MSLRALTSPSGPDRPPHAGVSSRAAETASAPPLQLPLSGSPQSRRAARRGPIVAGDITRGRHSAANQRGTLHLRGGAGSQSDNGTVAAASGQWGEETSEVRAARKRLRLGETFRRRGARCEETRASTNRGTPSQF